MAVAAAQDRCPLPLWLLPEQYSRCCGTKLVGGIRAALPSSALTASPPKLCIIHQLGSKRSCPRATLQFLVHRVEHQWQVCLGPILTVSSLC